MTERKVAPTLYAKRYTLAKQGGDKGAVFANTYETLKEMTRMHPNQYCPTLQSP